jgi:hypothetical protein
MRNEISGGYTPPGGGLSEEQRLRVTAGIVVHGVRPLAVTKKQAAIALGSIKTLQRVLWCARHQPGDPWVKIVREGGPGIECLIDTASLESAYARIYRGETPPLLPSERKSSSGRN